MTDELDRIRDLQGDAPGPDQAWVEQTRADLLARAEAEAATTAGQAGDEEAAGAEVVPLRRRMRAAVAGRRPAMAAAAAVVLVAAAGGVVAGLLPDDAASPDTATEGDDEDEPGPQPLALAGRCTGGGGRYTIGYPEGWHANPGEATGPCQFFDREPVALEPGTGGAPRTAITVRLLPRSFEQARQSDDTSRRLSSEPTTVAGRDAVREVRESTGRGALPAGVRSYRYLVDLGDRTLLAVTYDLGEADFAQRRDVLDRMLGTLTLDAPR